MHGDSKSGSLSGVRVGYASADITPAPGCWLSGFGFRDRPASGVHTRLYVRTLFFEGREGCYALSSCDLLGLTDDMIDGILAGVADLGISRENYLIAATHTHSGPVTVLQIAPVTRTMDEGWKQGFVEAVARSVREAASSVEQAEIASASSLLQGIAVNRRPVDPDGRIHFNPDQIDPEGAVDEDLDTVWLRLAPSGRTVCVSSFSCHPISLANKTNEDKDLISADFPGVAAGLLSMEGIELVHFSGNLGNINPIYICGGRQRCQELGERYASAVKEQAESLGFERLDAIRFASLDFDLPFEKPRSEEELLGFKAEQEAIIASSEHRIWEEVYHARQAAIYCDRYLARRARSEVIPESIGTRVQAVGFGRTAIVGHPFEMFVEIGMRLKEMHPAVTLLAAGLSGPRLGYLPTERASREGGYEVERSYIGDALPAPYGPESEHIVLEAMSRAVKSVVEPRD